MGVAPSHSKFAAKLVLSLALRVTKGDIDCWLKGQKAKTVMALSTFGET